MPICTSPSKPRRAKPPIYFDFHLDFTGWRACWIKYGDMPGDHFLAADLAHGDLHPRGRHERRTLPRPPDLRRNQTPTTRSPPTSRSPTTTATSSVRVLALGPASGNGSSTRTYEPLHELTPRREAGARSGQVAHHLDRRGQHVERQLHQRHDHPACAEGPSRAAGIHRTDDGGIIGAPRCSRTTSATARRANCVWTTSRTCSTPSP